MTEGEDSSKSPEVARDTDAAPTAEEAAAIAADAANDLQKVERLMGRQHLALYGFIGIFLAVLASAIAYLASRQQGPNPVAAMPTKPVTVISSAAPAPTPAVKTAPVVPQEPAPQQQPSVAAVPAVKPVAPPASVTAAVVTAKPAEQQQGTKPLLSSTPAAGALADVLPNRLYLQVGSLDKNVAELLTQGLRTKGVPATVAPGVSDTVARIIVGPFDSNAEMGVVQKQLAELGFTPFPRQFQPSELRPTAQNAAAVTPVSNKPVVKR